MEIITDIEPSNKIGSEPIIIEADFEEVAPTTVVTNPAGNTLYQSAVNGKWKEIVLGLAAALNWPKQHIDYILKSRKPKLITALCWKAGATPATAYQVQLQTLHIPAAQAIAPKGNKYSMSVESLEWYVEFIETALFEKFGV